MASTLAIASPLARLSAAGQSDSALSAAGNSDPALSARPATSASPAPTGLPPVTASWLTRHDPSSVVATDPERPSDTTTADAPSSRSDAAPASTRCSRPPSVMAVAASNSPSFGLTRSGPAAQASRSASPPVSTITRAVETERVTTVSVA
jgi:hypothetical protein